MQICFLSGSKYRSANNAFSYSLDASYYSLFLIYLNCATLKGSRNRLASFYLVLGGWDGGIIGYYPWEVKLDI